MEAANNEVSLREKTRTELSTRNEVYKCTNQSLKNNNEFGKTHTELSRRQTIKAI